MRKIFKNVTIGADPEAFVALGDEIISAEGLIGGTKEEPLKISDKGHAIQEDNIMVEFNIPASETKQDFIDNINYCKDYLNQLLAFNDMKLAIKASAHLDPIYLASKQACTFGCDPDINAYTKSYNDDVCKSEPTLRTCGGHIHIGFDNAMDVDPENKLKLIKAMDYVLGLESLDLDNDDKRRIMYGKAGSFRIKDYGVEYRTLSNFWIQNDELMEWAYDKTMEAIDLVESGEIDFIIKDYEKEIENIINNNLKDNVKILKKEVEQLKINK